MIRQMYQKIYKVDSIKPCQMFSNLHLKILGEISVAVYIYRMISKFYLKNIKIMRLPYFFLHNRSSRVL